MKPSTAATTLTHKSGIGKSEEKWVQKYNKSEAESEINNNNL